MNICHLLDNVRVVREFIGRLKKAAESLKALGGHEYFVDHAGAQE